MCGRATLISGIKDVKSLFGSNFESEMYNSWNDFFPNYNLAPTHFIPALLNDEDKSLSLLKWGLIPSWSKDDRMAYRMINARAETIREKPAYKNAFNKRRCLLALDGYYEWQGKEKNPWRIGSLDEKPFAVAGIWETKKTADGSILRTVSVITRPAVKALEHIHDRMPLTIQSDAFDYWLNNPFSEERDWMDFIDSALFPLEKTYRVSKIVNSVKNNNPECILPFEDSNPLLLFE